MTPKENTMNKEFVPYEQALELKKLGFDEMCFGNFKENQIELYRQFYCYNSDYVDHLAIYISAPLYQQAFRWFRENYGLIGWVEGKRVYRWCIESPIPTDGQLNFSPFKTYEEAELECLKKLIKIVKEIL